MHARPALQLRLIGEMALSRGGAPVPLPRSRKTRALLAYLAATGTAHRREKLCGLFWELPDDPKGALRWSLSKLRRLLDDPDRPRLVTDGEWVRVDLDDVATDLAALRGWREADPVALEALVSATPEGCFCDGIELPRCEEFGSWCAAMREDVRRLMIAANRGLLDRIGGDPERALPCLRRLIQLDPYDGAAWEALNGALIAAGRGIEAEAQRRIARQLFDEAGLPLPAGIERAADPGADAAAAAGPALPRQRVQFCTARDGTGLAYSCVGEGPALVKTANWLNHLEFEWESPIWRHWIAELCRDRMLLRYDERGNGLSDWKVKDLSFEAFVQDLETVVDAAGLDRFDMIGISQGGAVAIAYAVRHPERVRRMVLMGAYAMGWGVRAEPAEVARREAMLKLTGIGWGQDNPAFRQMFTTLYFPDATPEQAHWFNELQRVSASPEGAEALQRALSLIDVRPLLPQVAVPTIIFHARDDAVVPFENGRYLAAHIPGAQFVALDSGNHLLLEQEPAWAVLVDQMRAFLA